MKQNMLAVAISLAADKHKRQVDKAGLPYILHPLRIMMRLRTDDQELMQIAALHDVVEDSDITLEQLEIMGFSGVVLDALKLLTHESSVPYQEYVEKMKGNWYALRVKLEDLRDNSDITRLKGVSDKDVERMRKYHHAYLQVKGYLDELTPIHTLSKIRDQISRGLDE